MARARAILTAHGPEEKVASSHKHQDDDKHHQNSRYVDTIRHNTLLDSSRVVEHHHDDDIGDHHELPDDGLAPLGGDWGLKENFRNRPHGGPPPSLAVMLKNPATYLVDIYDAAVRSLQAQNYVDAQRGFEVVLDCQRHRHGLLHGDVAACTISALRICGRTIMPKRSRPLKSPVESARVVWARTIRWWRYV
jgi:hypothetical protein